MDGLTVILAVFAVYRLATDLAGERGPWSVFERLRGAVIQAWGGASWQAEGITCPICLSAWIALAPAALLASSPASFVLLWLGIAGAAAFVARVRWG